MGFYLRKSFRAGPVRLNLSKSGLGASVGVRGARLGVSSRGRTYVSGGRGGLYFHQNLSRGQRTTSGSSRGSREAVVIEEDTGATFAVDDREPIAQSVQLRLPPQPKYHVLAAILVYPLAATFALAIAITAVGESAGDAGGTALGILSIVLTLLWPALVVRQILRATRARRIRSRLSHLLVEDRSEDELTRIFDNPAVSNAELSYASHISYVELLDAILADDRIDDAELRWLETIEELLPLPKRFVSEVRLSGFRKKYLEAVADHELTKDEETTLDHLRDRLCLSSDDVAQEIETLDRLREIRQIREGDLSEMTCSRKLQRGEVCYFEGPGRILKRKNLRSFQEDGQRYKIEGLVIDKEGDLLITSKRLLVVHQGTTTIRIDRILDLELDLDRNLISVVKDGAQRPVLISTPDGQRAAAILASIAGL